MPLTKDILASSSELRKLRDLKLLEQKGRGSATYYQQGLLFPQHVKAVRKRRRRSTQASESAPQHDTLEPSHGNLDANHGALELSHGALAPHHGALASVVPDLLRTEIAALGQRPGEKIRPLILKICAIKSFTAAEISELLGGRNTQTLKKDHLKPLIQSGLLSYTHPDMEKHPKQSYRTAEKPDS